MQIPVTDIFGCGECCVIEKPRFASFVDLFLDILVRIEPCSQISCHSEGSNINVPTVRLSIFTLESCCFVPINMKSGKIKNFQGQGKSGKFAKGQGKSQFLSKVSEKSGNFVFRFCEVYEDIFIQN